MKIIDLFKITMDTNVWTFTNSDVEQSYDSGDGLEIYEPVAAQRGEIHKKGEVFKASLVIDIPIDYDLATTILSFFNDKVMSLSIFTARDGVITTTWKGRLSSYQPANEKLSLTFESVFTSLRRPGLRATFQRNCRHALYGRGCNLLPASFVTSATLNDISGNTLTVPEAALEVNGYFTGGMVEAPDGAFSYITRHISSSLRLQRIGGSLAKSFADNGAGLSVNIYPGCSHTRNICETKFDNLLNYGGFDWIPSINPMGGGSIL